MGIMDGTIKYVWIMNTICGICNEDKVLEIIIVKETEFGLVPLCVCPECATKFKVGDIIK